MVKHKKIRKFVFLTSILVICYLLLVVCTPVLADEASEAAKGLQGATGIFNLFAKPTGFTGTDQPEAVVGKVIQTFLVIIGTIFGILMVYGGYLWMIGMGNEERVKKAKGILEAATIGLIIVMGAYAISVFVVSKVIGAASFGV